jgi:PIN domain nuclease of toxin-antitoxin system
VNVIIDTHVFLWALSHPEKLGENRQAELQTPLNRVFVSAVSITEIMIKASLGKLAVNFDPVEMAQESGFELLEFSPRDALPLGALPFHHKDPFDRMLIAQSIARGYHLMTDDQKFSAYDCKLV